MNTEANNAEGSKFTLGTRYLSFSLGVEEYAVPLLSVKEVIAVPEVTSIPFTPTYFLGIMNLRGQVISILDLRLKLGMKSQNTTETSVIICDLSSVVLGIVVDSINSVLTPKPEDVSEKPSIQNTKSSDYISHVYRRDKNMILFLDLQKTLSVEDHAALNKASTSQSKGKAA